MKYRFIIFLTIFLSFKTGLSLAEDYGQVWNIKEWQTSRAEFKGCDVPKAKQIPIPLCPGCVIIDVRPNDDINPGTILIDLGSHSSLREIEQFYRRQSSLSYFKPMSDARRVLFVDKADAGQSHMEALQNMFARPQVLIKESMTMSDHPRHVIITTRVSGNFVCEYNDAEDY